MKAREKQIKNSKLREWLTVLGEKEWKIIIGVVEAKLIYLSPPALLALKHMHQYHKSFMKLIHSTNRRDVFEYDQYCKITDSSISKKTWTNIKSEIPKACALYMKIKLIKEKELEHNLALQRFFLDHGMRKNLDSINISNLKNIQGATFQDVYHGHSIMKHIELQINDVKNKNNRKKAFKEHEDIPTLDLYLESIDLSYYENKLRILAEKKARSFFDTHFILSKEENNFIHHVPQKYLHFPRVKMFFLSIKMFLEKSDSVFNELNEYIQREEIQEMFSAKYLSSVYSYFIVFCTIRMNDGEAVFEEHYLKFINILSENNLLLEQGGMLSWRFKNIIRVALKQNQLNWASDFYDKYKNDIKSNDKQIYLDYCKALILFHQGKEKETYHILSNRNLANDTLLKISYEFLFLHAALYIKDDSIDFVRLNDNFRGVINTKKTMAEDVKEKWRKAISLLGKVQNAADKSTRKKLAASIKNEDFFPGKDWLLNYIHKKS